MAAVTLAAEAVAAAGIWKIRSGEGQDIHVDVRKALRRLQHSSSLNGSWLMVDPLHLLPIPKSFPSYPPMTLWNKTRDGRWVMPCNIYPKLPVRATTLLRCDDSVVPIKMQCYNGAPMNLKRPLRKQVTLCDASITEEFMREPQGAYYGTPCHYPDIKKRRKTCWFTSNSWSQPSRSTRYRVFRNSSFVKCGMNYRVRWKGEQWPCYSKNYKQNSGRTEK